MYWVTYLVMEQPLLLNSESDAWLCDLLHKVLYENSIVYARNCHTGMVGIFGKNQSVT